MTIRIPGIQGEAPVVVGVEAFVQAGLEVPALEEIPEHWAYRDTNPKTPAEANWRAAAILARLAADLRNRARAQEGEAG